MKIVLLRACWLLLFSLAWQVSVGQIDTVYNAVSYPNAVYVPGALLKGYNFDTHIVFSNPLTWNYVPKENVRIYNKDTSFYAASEVGYGGTRVSFDIDVPRTLDTGYYDFHFKKGSFESVCKSCLHVSYDIHPSIQVSHPGVVATRGSFIYSSFSVNDIRFSDTKETDCLLRLKLRPQDVVLQHGAREIAADSLFISPNTYFSYPSYVYAFFSIPLDAPSGDYALNIKGDNQTCNIPIDTTNNHRYIYCDTVRASTTTLLGNETACIGQDLTIKVPENSAIEYRWTTEQGILLNDQDYSIFIPKDSLRTYYTIAVHRKAACGKMSPVYETISYTTEPRFPFPITGPTEVCGNSTNLYSIEKYGYPSLATWKLLHYTGDIVVTGDSAEIDFQSTPSWIL